MRNRYVYKPRNRKKWRAVAIETLFTRNGFKYRERTVGNYDTRQEAEEALKKYDQKFEPKH